VESNLEGIFLGNIVLSLDQGDEETRRSRGKKSQENTESMRMA
jgi:hypothetical protein